MEQLTGTSCTYFLPVTEVRRERGDTKLLRIEANTMNPDQTAL